MWTRYAASDFNGLPIRQVTRIVATMANYSARPSPSESHDPLAPAYALNALSDLDRDSANLAERVVTPWWYHAALGAIVALTVAAQALPQPAASTLVVLGILAIPLVMHSYGRRHGLATTQPAGPRSRRLLLISVGVLVGAFIAVLAFKLIGVPEVWLLLPASVAGMATVALGRRYDVALRQEIAEGWRRSA